jgi:hypothetical protein
MVFLKNLQTLCGQPPSGRPCKVVDTLRVATQWPTGRSFKVGDLDKHCPSVVPKLRLSIPLGSVKLGDGDFFHAAA